MTGVTNFSKAMSKPKSNLKNHEIFYHSCYLSKLVVGMFNLPTSDWYYFVDHK